MYSDSYEYYTSEEKISDQRSNDSPRSGKCLDILDDSRWNGTHYSSGRCSWSSLIDSDCNVPGYIINKKKCKVDDSGSIFKCNNTSCACQKGISLYSQDQNELIACCTGEREAKFCHPDYCKGNPNCNSIFARFCKEKDNILDIKCQRLKTDDKPLYNDIANSYCIVNNQNGEKFKSLICRDYCRENPTQCEGLLKSICKDKEPNSSWSSICGCNYRDPIYNTFREAIRKEWNAPPGVLESPPVCSFPECKLSEYKPDIDPKHPCPEVSLTNCTQSVNIDATGAVIGDIEIEMSAACKKQW